LVRDWAINFCPTSVEVDIICHVVRFFDDPSVVHVVGDVDGVRDREIVETELILADMQTLEKQANPYNDQGTPKSGITKEQLAQWGVIKKLRENLNNGNSREQWLLIRKS